MFTFMKVGFTGTSFGMTNYQKLKLRELLQAIAPTEFHHGDCIGADAEAHDIAANLGIDIVIHPPVIASKRAFCTLGRYTMRRVKPYLDRNRDIVVETEVLLATPKEWLEVLRSGTWATVRVARRLNKPVTLISPSEVPF